MPTIVMTGGTSGFGAVAAQRLRRSSDARLVLGARRSIPAGESVPLDLARLDSVRAFAVNHLAHYLLVRLLLPALADNAIVVLTTSGTHDPATGAGLATPRHADADLLADPDRDPGADPSTRQAGQRAYTASKLCAVLTARSLSKHPEVQARRITVVAYCPGQVFGTGLARDLSLPLRMVWSLLGTPVGWPLRRLNRNLNSRTAAGRGLADLALGVATPPPGRTYAALRAGHLTWPDPSELVRRDDLAQALWEDSARLTGLPDSDVGRPAAGGPTGGVAPRAR